MLPATLEIEGVYEETCIVHYNTIQYKYLSVDKNHQKYLFLDLSTKTIHFIFLAFLQISRQQTVMIRIFALIYIYTKPSKCFFLAYLSWSFNQICQLSMSTCTSDIFYTCKFFATYSRNIRYKEISMHAPSAGNVELSSLD